MTLLTNRIFFNTNEKLYIWSIKYGAFEWRRCHTISMDYIKYHSSNSFLKLDVKFINQIGNMVELQKLVCDFETFLLIDYLIDKNLSEFYSDSDDLLVYLKLKMPVIQNHTSV